MYSGIKSCRNGYRAISYPMTDKKHQIGERVGAFRCGGGIIDTGNASGIRKQFARIWKMSNRKIGDIQAYTILYSFSASELSPNDPDSLDRAADLAAAAIEKLYPDHQYTIVAQCDGKSGLVHVHATVNALNSVNLKACRGRQTSYRVVRDMIEKELEYNDIDIDYGKSHKKRDAKRKKRRDKLMNTETGNEAYSWLDDLADRIRAALAQTARFADLEKNLQKQDVTVEKKGKTNWLFVLNKAKDEAFNGKKTRGDRLGEAFTVKEMRKTVDANYLQVFKSAPDSDIVKEKHKERVRLAEAIAPREYKSSSANDGLSLGK